MKLHISLLLACVTISTYCSTPVMAATAYDDLDGEGGPKDEVADPRIDDGSLGSDIRLAASAMDDLIYGYIDGLLDVDISKQMSECDYWKRHAEQTFDDSWDLIKQSLSVWSIKYKLDMVTKAFTDILQITPGIFEDLKQCKGLEGSMDEVTEWAEKATDIKFMIDNLSSNISKNWFQISTMAVQISFKAVKLDWNGIGHDMGALIKQFIELPEKD